MGSVDQGHEKYLKITNSRNFSSVNEVLMNGPCLQIVSMDTGLSVGIYEAFRFSKTIFIKCVTTSSPFFKYICINQ